MMGIEEIKVTDSAKQIKNVKGICYFKLEDTNKNYLFYHLDEYVENDRMKMYVAEAGSTFGTQPPIDDATWTKLKTEVMHGLLNSNNSLTGIDFLPMKGEDIFLGDARKISVPTASITTFASNNIVTNASNELDVPVIGDTTDYTTVEETKSTENIPEKIEDQSNKDVEGKIKSIEEKIENCYKTLDVIKQEVAEISAQYKTKEEVPEMAAPVVEETAVVPEMVSPVVETAVVPEMAAPVVEETAVVPEMVTPVVETAVVPEMVAPVIPDVYNQVPVAPAVDAFAVPQIIDTAAPVTGTPDYTIDQAGGLLSPNQLTTEENTIRTM